MTAKAELRKFDAEIIRNLGYVLCTPFCLQILGYFLSQPNSLHLIKTPIAFMVTILGLMCVGQSYDIMAKGLKDD